jgi:hypothetical protein
VDIVIMVEISGEGRRDNATIPPMEWPMMMIWVCGGYSDKMYFMAADAYERSERSVGPCKADKSSLNSTVQRQFSDMAVKEMGAANWRTCEEI